MADNVYVNSKSAVHKGSSGKSAGCPSPQFLPPSPPAGPVPTPLPNMASASDLTEGAGSVTIDDNPQGHGDSYFSKSTGDEPALPPPTFAGVVSHQKNGKAYFASHSMDVFIEGKPAVTHADLTLHDCAHTPNTATWPFLSGMSPAEVGVCEGQPEECRLVPYKDGCGQSDGEKKELGTKGEAHKILTPHHILADHCVKGVVPKPGKEAYAHGDAPCICTPGRSWNSIGPNNEPLGHNRYHRHFDVAEAKACLIATGADLSKPASPGGIKAAGKWNYKDAKDVAAQSCHEIDGCARGCIEVQLKQYFEDRCGLKPDDKIDCAIHRGDIREEARKDLHKTNTSDVEGY